jgi:eukaryotic-like serine/threonine-protein kinase
MHTEKIENQIRQWFDAALDIHRALRVAWLEKNCADRLLRQRVLELIAAHESTEEPISQPVGEWFLALDEESELLEDEPDRLIGKNIAGFELLRHLGSGGMSSVYLARRVEAEFEQLAAVKVLKHNIYSATEQRMFRRERQLLAELEHPNIARFIDGGLTDAGLPYLIMEYVDGESITRHCDTRHLTHAQRVTLFLAVCRATDHAHRASIVHRDIKPANVLVTNSGEVKLLDFGIGKLIKPDEFTTVTAKVYLTPEYAAPEQFHKGSESTAVDVYSLGVLLHELLIGVRPNRDAPAKPSHLALQQATTDKIANINTKSLRRYLQGDLDNIIARATQADPNMRYRNAGELADDLDRFVQGQPVEAHPPSAWYRTKKFVHRHRGAVFVTFALVLGVFASLGLAVWQTQIARGQANLARNEAARANQVKSFLLDLFEAAQENLAPGERPTPAQLVLSAKQRLQANVDLDSGSRLDVLLALVKVGMTSGAYPESLTLIEQARILVDAQTPIVTSQLVSLLHADVLVKLGQPAQAITILDPLMPIFHTQESETAISAFIVRSQAASDSHDANTAVEFADALAVKASKMYPEDSRKGRILALAPGRARANVGDNVGAEKNLLAGLQTWRTSPISKDDEFATTLGTLAVVQFRLGKTQAALQAIDESIELLKVLHAGPTGSYISLLGSRATFLAELRQRDGGLADSAAAFEAASTLYGPNHPSTLRTLAGQAQAISRSGAREQSILISKDLMERCETAKLMQSNPDCIRALSSLAINLIKVERPNEAEPLLLRAVQLRRAHFGEQHPEMASALSSMGVLRAAQNRPLEALQYYDQALLILQRANAPANLIFAHLVSNRAKVSRDLGRHADAIAAFDQAIALYDQLTPADQKTRFQLRALKALSMLKKGQKTQAQALAKQAMEIGGTDALQALFESDRQQFRAGFLSTR